MPRPKRQPKRAVAGDFQYPEQARWPGRRRANRQQNDNSGQNIHAHQAQLAPPQPQEVQQPQAAPQHQAAISQQAAPPQQQAQDPILMHRVTSYHKPKSAIRIISIENWTDKFLIYFSIYIAVHPLTSQQFIKH